MKKRILTICLALLMVLPMLIACSDKGNETNTQAQDTTAAADAETTSSLYDENGYLLDKLPASLNFNQTITMLMWSDHTMHEFGTDVEEQNGDGIDAALFDREVKLEDRLGVRMEYVQTPGDSNNMNAFIAKAEADYKSDRSFDLYGGYSRTAPQMTLSGYTVDLLSTEYFNVDMPWWPEALVKECMFGDNLYFCSGDISTNMLWMMIATFYNKKLYEDYQYAKTPEQMVKDNEWTFDTFFSMTKDIYEDLDSDGKKGRADRYGAVVYDVNIDAFQTAAGITSIIRTNDGGIEINPAFTGERIELACSETGNWLASAGVFHENSTAIRNVFFEERSMFITDRVFIVAGKDNSSSSGKIDFDYGIIPQPKLNADQENFSTNLGAPFTMYAISSGSAHIDACSAVLECMASLNYRKVTPEVFDTAMKYKYAHDSEAAVMYDIIRANVSFDLGRLLPAIFGNHTANLFRKTAMENPSGYKAKYGAVSRVIEGGRDQLLSTIEELISK